MEKKYPYLEYLINWRGIKKAAIARAWGISSTSFNNKMNGLSPVLWDEVRILSERFFPEIDVFVLMSENKDFPKEAGDRK